MIALRTSIHLLTCAGREASLAETLASWAACDWAHETPRVFFNGDPPSTPGDDAAHRDAGQRVFAGFVAILKTALAGDADYFLLLEDDIAFAKNIRAAIHAWPPLLEGKIGCAHFYDPGLSMTAHCPEQRYKLADSWGVFGSQARLFTRECAEWLLPLYTLGAEHHDQQTARLVALRWPLYYHAPSLVQHTGRVSTWGAGDFHSAGDFVESAELPQ